MDDELTPSRSLKDLPGREALEKPGQKDETIVINHNNQAEVYKWYEDEKKWKQIGELSSDESDDEDMALRSKIIFEGKEYDYVLDVPVDDNGTVHKLPYNKGESKLHAAQKFIDKHGLDSSQLDLIVNHIEFNTEEDDFRAPAPAPAPAKIGAAATPSHHSSNAIAAQPPVRYSNNGLAIAGANSSGSFYNANEFQRPQQRQPPQQPVPKKEKQPLPAPETEKSTHFPATNYAFLPQPNAEAVLKKLKEFHQGSTVDIGPIEKTVSNINNLSDDTNYESTMKDLFNILDSLPADKQYPAIDLIRMTMINERFAETLVFNKDYLQKLFEIVESDENLINSNVVLRLYCNLFKWVENPTVLRALIEQRGKLFAKLEKKNTKKEQPSFQTAYATYLLNYVVLFKKLSVISEEYIKRHDINETFIEWTHYMNDIAPDLLKWDQEALYRMIVCYATITDKDSILDYDIILIVATALRGMRETCRATIFDSQNSTKYQQKIKESSIHLLNVIEPLDKD